MDEVVVCFDCRLLLSGVLGLDAMVLLNWCKLYFVRGKRWEEACEESELGGLSSEMRIGQGRRVLKEIEGCEESESWMAVFGSTLWNWVSGSLLMVAPGRSSNDRLRLTPIYTVLIAVKVSLNDARCGFNRVNNCSYLALLRCYRNLSPTLAPSYVCQDLPPTTVPSVQSTVRYQ